MAGFTLIFLLAFLLLNYFVIDKIDKNNEKTISQELITIKENCNVFILQAFVINQYNNSDIYFEKFGKDIATELSDVIKSEVGIYSQEGRLISASHIEKFNNLQYDDIQNAVNNKTSYTIKRSENRVEVYFSYPVVISGNKVGILRIIKDYSQLYNQGYEVTDFIFQVTIIIFAAVFLFTLLLSRNITLPLTKLARYTNEVSKGNLEVEAKSKRKDEIGVLYSNFNIMVKKIDEQIKTIRKDRDDLKQLINHKKYFYDNVTHELKTPLTSVLGYARMIQDNGFTDQEFFDKGMGHIINESKRLHTMVLNLLELSQQTSDIEETYEKVDMGKVIADACEVMVFNAGKYGINFNNEVENGLYVKGNANKLKQVLINIIDNAIKYGLTNSEIKVKAYRKEEAVYVDINNKGSGIQKEDLERIFTPFYRIDKQKSRELGSSGLGLNISKAIIETHKGEIFINSVINEATTVSVKLPAFDRQA